MESWGEKLGKAPKGQRDRVDDHKKNTGINEEEDKACVDWHRRIVHSFPPPPQPQRKLSLDSGQLRITTLRGENSIAGPPENFPSPRDNFPGGYLQRKAEDNFGGGDNFSQAGPPDNVPYSPPPEKIPGGVTGSRRGDGKGSQKRTTLRARRTDLSLPALDHDVEADGEQVVGCGRRRKGTRSRVGKGYRLEPEIDTTHARLIRLGPRWRLEENPFGE